jgi:hypothetical protein
MMCAGVLVLMFEGEDATFELFHPTARERAKICFAKVWHKKWRNSPATFTAFGYKWQSLSLQMFANAILLSFLPEGVRELVLVSGFLETCGKESHFLEKFGVWVAAGETRSNALR